MEKQNNITENLPQGSTDFYLINIWGLITKSKNKTEILRKLMQTRNKRKIFAINETYLSLDQYYSEEIAKYIHNCNIHRADRDAKYNSEDDYQLLPGGGCMLLTSPDIVAQLVLSFLNDNCEPLITEFIQLKTIVVTVCRPTVPNFSLNKFVEVLDRLQ